MAQLARDYALDGTASGAEPLRSALDRLKAWVAERRLRLRTMYELQKLDQRALHDLAISPNDFRAIARGTWKR